MSFYCQQEGGHRWLRRVSPSEDPVVRATARRITDGCLDLLMLAETLSHPGASACERQAALFIVSETRRMLEQLRHISAAQEAEAVYVTLRSTIREALNQKDYAGKAACAALPPEHP